MGIAHGLRRLAFAIVAHAVIAVGALSTPLLGLTTPASAQISEDAQVALEQFGTWRPHPRFGEVWVPGAVPPDWRPYQYGHWVYTDEWGWYWVSDDAEADWGWVVYHYGRWAFERGLGWFWVPGDEWAPAWVNWRYGEEYAGWAPLPPDDLIESYEVEPAYWLFVPTRFIGAPRLRTYYVPPFRRSVILRGTHVVNRTVPVRGRLAVNPGISPAFVARVNGAPVATYRVRPRVFAATQGVSGAVQVRREDLRGRNGRPSGPAGPGRPGRAGRAGSPGQPARLGAISVERTTTVVRPNATVTPPQPLGKNERGRLGTNPPRAAQGTPSVVPLQQQTPPGSPPPAAGQNQTPALQQQQQQPAGVAPPKTPTAPTAPTTTTPAPPPTPPPPAGRRDEHRDRVGPGGPPSQPPNIVRPIPPQAPPPPPPPPPQQQRQVQPPPAAVHPPAAPPPPPPQRQVQPPPPPAAHPPPPPPPPQRQVQPPPPPAAHPPPPPPPAARAPAPPPAAAPPPRPAGPPPKKPPPKPGEKPDEKK